MRDGKWATNTGTADCVRTYRLTFNKDPKYSGHTPQMPFISPINSVKSPLHLHAHACNRPRAQGPPAPHPNHGHRSRVAAQQGSTGRVAVLTLVQLRPDQRPHLYAQALEILGTAGSRTPLLL